MNLEDLGITEARSEDGLYFGYVSLPWFGADQLCRLGFDLDTNQHDPSQRQWTALESFLHQRSSIFANLEDRLLEYYQESKVAAAAYYDKAYLNSNFPELDSPAELKPLISIPRLVVSYFDSCSSSYISAIIDCSWDSELGVGVKFVDNRIQAIGTQDIVL